VQTFSVLSLIPNDLHSFLSRIAENGLAHEHLACKDRRPKRCRAYGAGEWRRAAAVADKDLKSPKAPLNTPKEVIYSGGAQFRHGLTAKGME
jgi:hypothetical protein